MVYMVSIWSATLVAGVLSTVPRVDDEVGHPGGVDGRVLARLSWSSSSRPPLPTTPT